MEGLVLREGLTATSEPNWEGKDCLVLAGFDNEERIFRLQLTPKELEKLLGYVSQFSPTTRTVL